MRTASVPAIPSSPFVPQGWSLSRLPYGALRAALTGSTPAEEFPDTRECQAVTRRADSLRRGRAEGKPCR